MGREGEEDQKLDIATTSKRSLGRRYGSAIQIGAG